MLRSPDKTCHTCILQGPSSSDMLLPLLQRVIYKECDFPNREPQERDSTSWRGHLLFPLGELCLLCSSYCTKNRTGTGLPQRAEQEPALGPEVGPAIPQAERRKPEEDISRPNGHTRQTSTNAHRRRISLWSLSWSHLPPLSCSLRSSI